ncbi:MAG: hypothetical protein AAFP26_03010 [Planctomycetota bacterium]
MSDSLHALCTDFYVNLKLNVKMELPQSRETILDLFERLRRDHPEMSALRRQRDEISLEAPQSARPHRWVALKQSSIRAGVVNPTNSVEAYGLHRTLLELTPFYLSVSPLDVDYLELLFGFDLAAPGNHDRIVADALLAGSPLARALDAAPGAGVIECQPLVGVVLDAGGQVEAHVEVKTRRSTNADDNAREEPISVYVTLRHFGRVTDAAELPQRLEELAERGERLCEDSVAPALLAPLRETIATGNL